MRGAALVFAGLLAGCDATTAPSDPTLSFESAVVFGLPTVPVSAMIDGHDVVVSAIVRAPTTGYTFSGGILSHDGATLTLQVEAVLTGAAFPFATWNYYKATIHNLARGPVDLRVMHVLHYSDTLITQEELHQTLKVP